MFTYKFKVILPLIFSLCAPTALNAADCPDGATEVYKHVKAWKRYVYDSLEEFDAHLAVQDLKTEAQRVGRALGELDVGNHLLARYRDIIQEIDRANGPEAGSRVAENIFRQIRWASQSLNSMSSCLAQVPVDVPNSQHVTLAGAVTLMTYVEPEIFKSIGIVERELRGNAPLTSEEGQALFQSFKTINRLVDLGGGSFTACQNKLQTAKSSGAQFSVSGQFLGKTDRFVLKVGADMANMTLQEVAESCDTSD